MKKQTIKVYPNKWLSLDAQGNPCAVVPIDFFEHGPGRRWVGAKLSANMTAPAVLQRVGKLTQEVTPAQFDQIWTFTDDAVEIPLTKYYVQRLRTGELIVADAESALAAGVAYSDPQKRLEEAKAAAVKAYDAQHGKGAWAAAHETIPETQHSAQNQPAQKGGRKSSTPQE